MFRRTSTPTRDSWEGEPPGVVSPREAEVASLDARFLPEERNYTLIDAFGLTQGRDTGLLHDLESSHFRSLMGVIGVHDLAGCGAEALDIVGHIADRRINTVLDGTIASSNTVYRVDCCVYGGDC